MKIVNLQTLLEQPNGVLFAKYESIIVGPLCIFGGRWSDNDDFTYAEINPYTIALPEGVNSWTDYWLGHMETGGEARPDFECWGRDGCFEPKQQFILLDATDVGVLFNTIAKSLREAYAVANPAELLKE